MPVAPPTSTIGRWPARWKRRSIDQAHQTADVQAIGRRIEADVDRARLGGQPGRQGRVVGRLLNQAAPFQIAVDIERHA